VIAINSKQIKAEKQFSAPYLIYWHFKDFCKASKSQMLQLQVNKESW